MSRGCFRARLGLMLLIWIHFSAASPSSSEYAKQECSVLKVASRDRLHMFKGGNEWTCTEAERLLRQGVGLDIALGYCAANHYDVAKRSTYSAYWNSIPTLQRQIILR